MLHKVHKRFGRTAFSSVWIFPLILAVTVLVFTFLKISGTSAGVYHQTLYGNSSKDSNLIYGEPLGIRSDEWLVNSQLIVSQHENGFPRINKDLGGGRDVSLIVDVPYKEWSALFKPQNFSFFVMPLENAFAFKWWGMLALLIISCYFFTLKILPKRKLFAVLFSLAVGFSPFIFWWYQTITIMPLAYAFLIMILGMRILDKERTPWVKKTWLSDALHCAALAYFLACFALILYPPFQITIVLAVASFFVGYVLQKTIVNKTQWKIIAKRIAIIVAGLVAAIGVTAIFVLTRLEAVKAVLGTSHPGTRIIPPGGLNFLNVFDSFLMPLLQNSSRAPHFFNNQSEASNFILLLPFLLLPGFVALIYQYKKRRRIDFVLLCTQLCALLLLVRGFVPYGGSFYHILLLHKVPDERLVMGLGLLGIIQIIYIVKLLSGLKLKQSYAALSVFAYGLACFMALLLVGYFVKVHYPLFVTNKWEVVALAAVFTAMIITLLMRRFIVFAIILLAFSFYSVKNTNPLYKGLGVLKDNQVSKEIKTLSRPDDTWVSVDNILFESFARMAGRNSLTGVQIYPDVKLWHQVEGGKGEYIYNRYAHAIFMNDPSNPAKMWLIQKNVFAVKLTCDSFTTKNIDYMLSTSKIDNQCTTFIKTVHYPRLDFYFYKIKG